MFLDIFNKYIHVFLWKILNIKNILYLHKTSGTMFLLKKLINNKEE